MGALETRIAALVEEMQRRIEAVLGKLSNRPLSQETLRRLRATLTAALAGDAS